VNTVALMPMVVRRSAKNIGAVNFRGAASLDRHHGKGETT
jgi:hypothetical protein